MEMARWWKTCGVYVDDNPKTTVYCVKCRSCGEIFEAWQLYELPDECPECGEEAME